LTLKSGVNEGEQIFVVVGNVGPYIVAEPEILLKVKFFPDFVISAPGPACP